MKIGSIRGQQCVDFYPSLRLEFQMAEMDTTPEGLVKRQFVTEVTIRNKRQSFKRQSLIYAQYSSRAERRHSGAKLSKRILLAC